MRLDKYLAETAQCTRSEAKTLLQKGKVTVNGTLCKKGDTQLRETDVVAVEGRPLAYQKFVYIMLNKPEGVVSASTDKRDTTVVDLLGDAYPRRELFPAGRLDKTSTGFVLLTDDGGFAHDILAPKRHVSKTYTVTLDTPLTDAMRRGFAAGVTLTDGEMMAPAGVEPLTDDGLTVQVTLRQGVYQGFHLRSGGAVGLRIRYSGLLDGGLANNRQGNYAADGQHCGDDGNQGQEAQCDIQDMFFHFDHDVPLPRRRAALLLSLLCEWAKPLGGPKMGRWQGAADGILMPGARRAVVWRGRNAARAHFLGPSKCLCSDYNRWGGI